MTFVSQSVECQKCLVRTVELLWSNKQLSVKTTFKVWVFPKPFGYSSSPPEVITLPYSFRHTERIRNFGCWWVASCVESSHHSLCNWSETQIINWFSSFRVSRVHPRKTLVSWGRNQNLKSVTVFYPNYILSFWVKVCYHI